MDSTALRRTMLTLVGLVAASTASAGTITTWTGTNGANWSASGNWKPSTPTTTGTFSLVYFGNTAAVTGTNNIGPVTVDSILFNNSGTTGQTRQYTLAASGSGSLKLTSGGSVTSTASTGSTLTDTISNNVQLLGTSTFNQGTNHNLTISGSLTGGSILKTGAGDLSLTGAASLSAGNSLNINQGSVTLNNTSFSVLDNQQVGLGSAGNSGVLKFNGVTSGSTAATFSLNGSAALSPQQFSNITFTSGTFNSATSGTTPITLTLAGGFQSQIGTDTINGVIQDNSPTGKVSVTLGSGVTSNVWVLKGNNTYTGATTITANAKMIMDGVISGSSATTSSGYLGGSGTFAGAVSVLSGTLSPGGTSTANGVINDSIGTLTIGSLTLANPATVAMTVSGSSAGQYDQIVTNSIDYAGTLALTLSGSYADYTSFNLFSGFGASHTGDLLGISLSALGSPYSSLSFAAAPVDGGDWYTGWNDFHQRLKFSQSTGTLTVVPEPSSIVFAGIGLAMFGWSTWTRRRSNARRRALEAVVA